MIKSVVSVHDRSQIETTFDYVVNPKSYKGKLSLPYNCCVDAFFFVPRQMDLHADIYRKSEFYQDLKAVVRLKEPHFSLKDLGKKSVHSPLRSISEVFESGEELQSDVLIAKGRLFACSFSRLLSKRIFRYNKEIQKLRKNEPDNLVARDEILATVEQFLLETRKLLQEWLEVSSIRARASKKLERAFDFTDEYCFDCLKDAVTHFRALIRGEISSRKGGVSSEFETLNRKSHVWIRYLRLIYTARGYLWVSRKQEELEKEKYILRKRFLKRNIWQVLFLDMVTPPLFILRQQLGYMFAAAFAATWALAANIFIWYRLRFGGFNSLLESEGVLGISSIFIAFAFIMVYVLKDRIKEIGRIKIGESFFGKVPDNKKKILYVTEFAKKFVLGVVEETCSWVKNVEKVPAEVFGLRTRLLTGLEDRDSEEILHYQKEMSIRRDVLHEVHPGISTVHDILRLNVNRFLPKLDDPLQSYDCLEVDGSCYRLRIPKTYYLDVVLLYSKRTRRRHLSRLALDGYRLVLDKNGLVRVEGAIREELEEEPGGG